MLLLSLGGNGTFGFGHLIGVLHRAQVEIRAQLAKLCTHDGVFFDKPVDLALVS
jgi:hypothetical protein